jgi:hypothetical protein
MVIEAIKNSLKKIDKEYCKLSQKDYTQAEFLAREKYLERPFAYEFYHQLRKLMDCGEVDFGGPIIQAEVSKEYQHCFINGKIPDFVIHLPNKNKNLAVIEFKLATNPKGFEDDFKKLVEFKKNKYLEYDNAVEVVIGSGSELIKAKEKINQLNKSSGEEIIIIEFNTDSWDATESNIRFQEFQGHPT